MPNSISLVNLRRFRFRFVAVEGAQTRQKKEFVTRLCQRYSMQLIESDQSNPFIEYFADNPDRFTFPFLVSLLYERQIQARQIIDLSERLRICCDFTFDREEVIAQTHLNQEEFYIYKRLMSSLLPEIPIPDLVIFLHSSREFIISRQIQIDQSLSRATNPDLILRINDALNNFFYTLDKVPILIINMDNLNLMENEAFEAICQMLDDFKGRRQFFNHQYE